MDDSEEFSLGFHVDGHFLPSSTNMYWKVVSEQCLDVLVGQYPASRRQLSSDDVTRAS
jgi:hypothetical protein